MLPSSHTVPKTRLRACRLPVREIRAIRGYPGAIRYPGYQGAIRGQAIRAIRGHTTHFLDMRRAVMIKAILDPIDPNDRP